MSDMSTRPNRPVSGGGYFQRDREWHPPAYAPGYKTTVLRSPQKALLSLDSTLSEITGPVFGHAMLGEMDGDLIHNYAQSGEAAVGQRLIVHGRVMDETGRGVPFSSTSTLTRSSLAGPMPPPWPPAT